MPASIRSAIRNPLTVTLLRVAAGVVFIAKTSGSDRAPALRSMPAIEHIAPQGQGRNSHGQLIRVFLHEFDIYPDLVRVRPGKIFLSAENEQRREIALVVERVNPGQAPQRAARISVMPHIKRAGEDLALGTGEYVFYEESKPEIKGRIIVEPQ